MDYSILLDCTNFSFRSCSATFFGQRWSRPITCSTRTWMSFGSIFQSTHCVSISFKLIRLRRPLLQCLGASFLWVAVWRILENFPKLLELRMSLPKEGLISVKRPSLTCRSINYSFSDIKLPNLWNEKDWRVEIRNLYQDLCSESLDTSITH